MSDDKPGPLLKAVEVDADLIQNVVTKLNRICKAATFDFAINVGRLIIDNFYSGDLHAWRYRGAKNVSFRKLANHSDLPMSPSALYRSVAIYEVCERLGIHETQHLSTSHIRLVLPLPEKAQRRLLHAAEREQWPVVRLRKEIEQVRDRARAPTAAPADRQMVDSIGSTIRAMERWLRDNDHAAWTEELDLHEMPPDIASAYVTVIQRMRNRCDELENSLSGHLVERQSGPALPFTPTIEQEQSTG